MSPEIWGTVADWAQAVSSTVVLFLILLQMRQVSRQMLQADDHTRFSHSWEFVMFYREELKRTDYDLEPYLDTFNPLEASSDSEEFRLFHSQFFKPRIHLFALLNQLIQQQAVDERVLFGYLEDDFNKFVEIGVKISGSKDFRASMGGKISLLLTLWGSHIKSSNLLYGGS